MRLNETVYNRDKSEYLRNVVHDEWLGNVLAGHEESYQEWAEYAAWLIMKCVIPEQPDGNVA